MKKLFLILSIACLSLTVSAQTLQDAKKLYNEENYTEALPILETLHKTRPNDVSLNLMYGISLYMTGGDLEVAEKSLLQASKRNQHEANMYLGAIYSDRYEFEQAEKYLSLYDKHLNRKGRRSKAQQELEDIALKKLAEHQRVMKQLKRMVTNTEDIQIIDSILIEKDIFLSACPLSSSGGRVSTFSDVFNTNIAVKSTVYINEKETKMYYAQPDTAGIYSLYTMEYLLNQFGNERKMSKENFGLEGSQNYPFVMPDGVTVYFAASDTESIGGYDLFITRYNMNNDTYLKPERLNMPFNSRGNDYMMIVDEEKGVGWFATDRGLEDSLVCIYTFIPNSSVKTVESEDDTYLVNRARITSIKDTWQKDTDYSAVIAEARKQPEQKQKIRKDFELVINDALTYYTLHDFQDKSARDIYYKVIQMKSELNSLTDSLNAERDKYAAAKNNSGKILQMEQQQKQLNKDIADLEIDARNREIMTIGLK